MVFNSLAYFAFLPLVLLAFLVARKHARPLVLLAASVVFYGAFRAPELLAALATVTVTSYAAGLVMARTEREAVRRWALWSGIVLNLAVLFGLRYQAHVVGAVRLALEAIGYSGAPRVSPTLMSVGVSFYAFQGISFLIDLYVGVAEVERNFGRFALYMSFFPKLLQGPIERASDLLPQLRSFAGPSLDDARAGLFTFAWGLFKKIVIADRLSMFTGAVFSNVRAFEGPSLLIATGLYALEIYLDFSGYTDMAIGSARLFGVRLTQNFNRPYLATSVLEFWRRWHISFSRWILDYIFKPLQMEMRSWRTAGSVVALIVTFLASGVWHGASWTFVVWGGLHGIYMSCSVLTRSARTRALTRAGLAGSRAIRVWRTAFVFVLVSLAWIFFRAERLGDALYVVSHLPSGLTAATLLSPASWSHSLLLDQSWREAALVSACLGVMALAGMARSRYGLDSPEVFLQRSPAWARWMAYYAIGFALVIVPAPAARAFIYYQF